MRKAFARGLDCNHPLDESANSALHLACYSGWVEGIEFLLASGANPVGTNKVGYTPLHAAAQSGRREPLEIILAQPGVDPNLRTVQYGYTPLVLASMAICGDAVRVLLAAGCDPLEGCSDMNLTPVMAAAQCERADCLVAFMEANEEVSQMLQTDLFWQNLRTHMTSKTNPDARIERLRRAVAAQATLATIGAAMSDEDVAPRSGQAAGPAPL